MLLVGGKKIEEATTEEFFANPQTEMSRLFIEGKLTG
jgi:ABC-type phosphate transport system ATPase subunit